MQTSFKKHESYCKFSYAKVAEHCEKGREASTTYQLTQYPSFLSQIVAHSPCS